VLNTITFRRAACAALLNTPCFCSVSLNWYSVLKKVSSNEKQIKNQIKKYRSKPDLYSEEKIRTPYINPSQIKTTGIFVEFDWQKGIIQTNNIAYLEWVATNECHFCNLAKLRDKRSGQVNHFRQYSPLQLTNATMFQKNNKRCHSSFFYFFTYLGNLLQILIWVPLASGS